MAQTERELVEPALRARIRLRLRGVGMHDQIETSLQVVEDRDFLARHQQRVRRAEAIGLVLRSEPRLDPGDRLETEISDEPAGERRKTGKLRHLVRRADAFDLGERIGELARFDDFAELFDRQRAAAQHVNAPARQADDRMASPVFAALDRLEKIRVRRVGELEVHRQRRVEIGQHLARNRNAVVALCRECVELVLRNHRRPAREMRLRR